MMEIKRQAVALVVVAGTALVLWSAVAEGKGPDAKDKAAMAALDREIDGAVVYTGRGGVWKIEIGKTEPVKLGSGQYARWSPDGKRIAVYDGGKVEVMDADGGNRKTLAQGDRGDGSPIEFGHDGTYIIYWVKRKGFHAVDLATGKSRKLDLPGEYSGEPCLSADGSRLVARWRHDLYAIDVKSGKHHKFARGCSPGVSPDGSRVMSNLGGHKEIAVRGWGSGKSRKLSGRSCRPDGKWDNHHWSNHPDYIAAQGDGRAKESYVYRLSTQQGTRVTWSGGTGYPDLWVDVKGDGNADGGETKGDGGDVDGGSARPQSAWAGGVEKVVFVWGRAGDTNQAVDGRTGKAVDCRVEPHGRAVFARSGTMRLTGGGFEAEYDADVLRAAVLKTKTLSVEMVVTPGEAKQEGTILAYKAQAVGNLFAVGQSGDYLTFSIAERRDDGSKQSVTHRLGKARAGQPTHVAVAISPRKLVVWIDGEAVTNENSPSVWLDTIPQGELMFGDPSREVNPATQSPVPWSGQVQGVLIAAAFADDKAVARRAAWWRERLTAEAKTAPRPIVVEGVVEATSTIPDPKRITPYRRALVVNRYRVEKVIDGKVESKHLHVAQWAVLDGERLKEANWRKGDRMRLTIEPFKAHPQLSSEHLTDELDDLDAAVWYALDVERVGG